MQQIDSGSAEFSIRQQEFTALAPAYLGNIPVSVQQASCSEHPLVFCCSQSTSSANADGNVPSHMPYNISLKLGNLPLNMSHLTEVNSWAVHHCVAACQPVTNLSHVHAPCELHRRVKTGNVRKQYITIGYDGLQVDCGISGNIVIRVLEYRPSGGGYLKLTFLNIIGGIDSVLVSKTQADVRHHQTCSLSVL